MHRTTFKYIATLSILALLTSGCSIGLPKLKIPRVHKVTVQQGNVLTQEMIDRLKPGMTRNQVAYIMGEPVIQSTFDENRWDYIYNLEIPGYVSQNIHVTLYFENEVLAYFTGDLAPSAAEPSAGEPSVGENEGSAATANTAEKAS
ncbi:MAG: outer membrane protein assembly factor BamE [Pseudomonadota bacterium]